MSILILSQSNYGYSCFIDIAMVVKLHNKSLMAMP